MKVKTIKFPQKIVQPFTANDIQRLLGYCDAGTRKGARNQALILVLLDTGLRASELANLNLAEVDFTAQRMLIKHAKGNKQRVVRFGERARQALSTTRRVRIHGQVGEALEQRWGERADERATRLAQHFVEAAMLTPRHAEKAMHYSKLAAEQAEAQYGWDEAARHYEDCLTLAGASDDAQSKEEGDLLLALGI